MQPINGIKRNILPAMAAAMCILLLGAASRGVPVTVTTPQGKSIDLYRDSHALVVGNGNYTGGWDALPGAVQDVNDPDDACRYANVHDQTSKRINKFDWHNHNCEDGYAVTAPVGRFRPNAFGLYDMLGNIWEWCADIYAGDAYGKHKRHNPIQEYGGSLRVIRGGGWRDGPRYVRCALRDRAHPDGRGRSVGFRLLRME